MGLTKRAAYEMALHVQHMLAHHKDELLIRVQADYPDSANPLDAWIEDSFAPLTALGESHTDLFQAIEEGMTLEQYVGSARIGPATDHGSGR